MQKRAESKSWMLSGLILAILGFRQILSESMLDYFCAAIDAWIEVK